MTATQNATERPETLATLLGGRRGALDATLPVVAYAIAYLASGRAIGWSAVAALVASAAVAGWRLRQGAKPRAVLFGALVVAASAYLAVRTGRAEDFFLLRIFSNALSAIAWALSIALRWPLLGLVVGTVLGQRTRWRRDPDLSRAYSRASWVWVGQYIVRLAVLIPLWAGGLVTALAVAQVALTWPLIAACLVVSWWVLRRSLPAEHQGLRHPSAQ